MVTRTAATRLIQVRILSCAPYIGDVVQSVEQRIHIPYVGGSIPPVTTSHLEEWQSGLLQEIANLPSGKPARGFESHLLRQMINSAVYRNLIRTNSGLSKI